MYNFFLFQSYCSVGEGLLLSCSSSTASNWITAMK